MNSDDKVELEAWLDEAAREFLRKLGGSAMVALIARDDGKVLFSSCGVGLVTEQQHALLEEAGGLLVEVAMRCTAQAEVVSDHGGRYRKPERVN
jgi:hypothetical protein